MADPVRLIVLALLTITGSASAQSADPTRPPAAWLAQGDAAVSSSGDDDASGGLHLQSVLMRQGGRPVAIIGGKTVPLGGTVGGATLVRLTEREAVLKGVDGVTRLYLTPDVEKHMIETPKSRRTGKSGPVKGLP